LHNPFFFRSREIASSREMEWIMKDTWDINMVLVMMMPSRLGHDAL
jgi:hypothetical protein